MTMERIIMGLQWGTMGSSAIMSHMYSMYLQQSKHQEHHWLAFVTTKRLFNINDNYTKKCSSFQLKLACKESSGISTCLYLLCEGDIPGGQRFIENM